MGLAVCAIEVVGEGFEIDVGGVEEIAGIIDGLDGHVTITDKDVGYILPVSEAAAVSSQFHEYGGFGVGVGDAGAAVVAGGGNDAGGVAGLAGQMRLKARQLTNLPVLAEITLEITAGTGDRETFSAGLKVEKRFLFDGVDRTGADGGVGEGVQRAVIITADTTAAQLAVGDAAAEIAEVALNGVGFFWLP